MLWIEYAITGLFGLSAGIAGLVLADSAVRWIESYRRIRAQLEDIRNN